MEIPVKICVQEMFHVFWIYRENNAIRCKDTKGRKSV